jgi:hypothetical protein
MHAIVVFESHWGNTEAVARAIGEGIGAGAEILATDAATPAVLATADLVIAGAPTMAFRLPTDAMLKHVADDPKAPSPGDVSHPSMRSWLDELPGTTIGLSARRRFEAAFETALHWSPGGAKGSIDKALRRAGYRRAGAPMRFFVEGSYGPLREGELDRAREWGASLAKVAI